MVNDLVKKNMVKIFSCFFLSNEEKEKKKATNYKLAKASYEEKYDPYIQINTILYPKLNHTWPKNSTFYFEFLEEKTIWYLTWKGRIVQAFIILVTFFFFFLGTSYFILYINLVIKMYPKVTRIEIQMCLSIIESWK